jgi:hypothetical protein
VRNAKKRAVHAVVAAAIAAAGAVAIPADAAWATNVVDCNQEDFLQVSLHISDGPGWKICYANAGRIDLPDNIWVDEISTGNNSITYHDRNGDNVSIDHWNLWTFWGNARHIEYIDVY